MSYLKKIKKISFCFAMGLPCLIAYISFMMSIINLQYSETMEIDGYEVCDNIKSNLVECNKSKENQADNDNETIQVLVEMKLSQSILIIPLINYSLVSYLPVYKNLYLFSYNPEVIKPPILNG